MGNLDRQGVTVNGQFYGFARHILEKWSGGDHLEATDEFIILTLSNPDHVERTEGNRTVYWKKIQEIDGEWWLLVVVTAEESGLQVLSAYENTERGAKLWETQ